jgi:hypothetical protein
MNATFSQAAGDTLMDLASTDWVDGKCCFSIWLVERGVRGRERQSDLPALERGKNGAGQTQALVSKGMVARQIQQHDVPWFAGKWGVYVSSRMAEECGHGRIVQCP